MIIITTPTGNQMRGLKWTTMIESGVVEKLPSQIVDDFCYCAFTCDKEFKAFTHPTDTYKKDSFSLFSQIKATHTVNFYLIKEGVEYELTDSTYGTYNNFSTSTKQYIVDWTKVANQLGNGIYSLKIVQFSIGDTIEKTYGNFRVMPFDQIEADGTIRIETNQNGYLEHSYDFSNFNIYSQIRLDGRVFNEQIVSETNSNETSKRRQKQVHDRQFREYDIEFNGLSEKTMQLLLDEYLFADTIIINDYNFMNKTYRDLEIRRQSIELSEVNRNDNYFIVKAQDYVQNQRKRTI